MPVTGTVWSLIAGAEIVGAPGGAYTLTVTVLVGLESPETGSVSVAASVCAPIARLSENDQVPSAATVVVYVVCASTTSVSVSPGAPVPGTGTGRSELLLESAEMTGVAGGA